VTFSKFYKKA